MLHPHTELRFINETVGHGVFATKFIPKGTILWTLCLFDKQYTLAEFSNLPTAYQKMIYQHSYTNARGKLLFCWDAGRFVNHSCQANCLFVGPDLEIAVRDIAVGEEITCEYGALNACEKLTCACQINGCRRIISNTDVLTFGEIWDALSISALQHAKEVTQPLYPFIQDKQFFEAIVAGVKDAPKHALLFRPPLINDHATHVA